MKFFLRKLVISLGLVILLYSCVDLPDDVAVPVYDVSFVLPVAERTYSLQEAVEEDSAYINWYKDPTRLGQLYYSDEISIERINIEDNLKIDPFSTTASQKIGTIKFNSPSDVNTSIAIGEWAEGISTGVGMIFPEVSNTIKSDFGSIEQFESLTFDDVSSEQVNRLNITVTNNFPVVAELRGIALINADTDELVLKKGDAVSSEDWVIIQPGESEIVTFDLAGKTMPNNIAYQGLIYSSGSGGLFVVVQEGASLDLLAEFSDNLLIKSITADLPVQDQIVVADDFNIDDSSKIQNAVIDDGFLFISVVNDMGVGFNSVLEVEALLDNNGQPFTREIDLAANSSLTISEADLSGWQINPTEASGALSYRLTVSPIDTENSVTVTKNDSINAEISFGEITFRSVQGQLKPIKFEIEETSQTIDFDSFEDKFSYDKIRLEDAELRLDLQTSANVELKLDGDLSVMFDNGERRSEQLEIYIPSSEPAPIDLGNLINGTNGDLPNKFFINGTAIVNPNYQPNIFITNTDTLGGKAFIDLPLNATISGGAINDTLELDESDIDDEDAERLNSASITIEIFNKIPFTGSFSGGLYDDDNNKLLDLPPSVVQGGAEADKFTITAPAVDAQGNVTEAGYNKQVIEITGEDVKAFNRATKIILSINFETADADQDKLVKFRYTDEITVKITAEASINVSE